VAVARSAHSWIRHWPTAHMARPLDHTGVFLRPVLSPKANSWLYIRPCLTKFKTPFIWEVLVGPNADAAVTTKADNNIIYTQNMYDSSRLNRHVVTAKRRRVAQKTGRHRRRHLTDYRRSSPIHMTISYHTRKNAKNISTVIITYNLNFISDILCIVNALIHAGIRYITLTVSVTKLPK